MEYKKLNELCEINIGKTPSRNKVEYWGKGSSWLSISDLKDKFITKTKEEITGLAVSECNMKIVAKDTVVMSFKLSIGKTAILKESMYTNEAIANFPIKNNSLIPEYLYYALNTLNFNNTDRAVMGATLNKSKLNELKIPYCDVYKQKEIVKILDKAQDLIDKRKEQIKALDELVKSQFIKMFGDEHNKIPIGDLCSIKARIGWQGLTRKEYLQEGNYRLVTGVDFKNGKVDFERCYYVTKDRYEQDENIKVKVGDVLVTKDGTIGKVAIVDKVDIPATLNSGVFVVRDITGKLNNIFLVNALLSDDFKRFVDNIKVGATVPHLNQGTFVKYEIPVPPIELQSQFADFAKQVDKLKFEMEKCLKASENNLELINLI